MFKVTTRIYFIQITLLFLATIVNIFFGLNGNIVYYIWSVWVCSNLIILLFRLPLNKQCLFTFMVNILLILTIGGLVGNFFVGFLDYIYYYEVNTGESPKSSGNINSGCGDNGNNNPQPAKDGLVVKNPDSHDSKYKGKGLPQSTSANSINSNISYTSTDIAIQTNLEKQNFRNVVNTDVDKATDLYNQKADELTKAKAELAKIKKSDKISVGFKLEEEKPF